MAPNPLTKREDEIRHLVVDGLTNDAIASELGISARTVEAHLRMLFRKMGASRRDQLAGPPGQSRPRHPDEGDVVEHLERRLADREDRIEELERRVRELDGQLAGRDRQVMSYDAAIQRMIERQFSLFEERVELEVTIGDRPGKDMVVERHFTTPTPYLVNRVIRPITPLDLPVDMATDMLAPVGEVLDVDVGVTVEMVSDRKGRPRAAIFFQPGLNGPTEWVLRYRTPGLWEPLREKGRDKLLWATGTLDGQRNAAIHDLTVRFQFPTGATGVQLTEHEGVGQVELVDSGHGIDAVYRDLSRIGARYQWELAMDWTASDDAGR